MNQVKLEIGARSSKKWLRHLVEQVFFNLWSFYLIKDKNFCLKHRYSTCAVRPHRTCPHFRPTVRFASFPEFFRFLFCRKKHAHRTTPPYLPTFFHLTKFGFLFQTVRGHQNRINNIHLFCCISIGLKINELTRK